MKYNRILTIPELQPTADDPLTEEEEMPIFDVDIRNLTTSSLDRDSCQNEDV